MTKEEINKAFESGDSIVVRFKMRGGVTVDKAIEIVKECVGKEPIFLYQWMGKA